MTYCRQGHTLVDNEAEAGWDRLPPATFFELVVSATTFFGIVDEYTPPTPTTLVCRLYTDPARTILHTTPIATGVPYEINNGVDYSHDAKDIELAVDQGMGVWRSPPVTIRDDTGVWGGSWIASPRPDGTVEFNFDGTHTLFKSSVEAPLISEQAGAGLGAGTYEYCIVPVDSSGRLGGSSRTQIITLAGAADILIDWLPNTQVTNWNVYGRQSGGTFGLLATLPGATVSYLDNGTDVPNPAFLPPLFEDPAWTPAVINREQSGTDSDVDYIAEGLEDGSTKLDDGSSISTFTADGTVDIQNTVESLGFDLTNLVSHSSEGTDKVLDPNLFTEDTGPVESLPPKVITYDYHVFINDIGETVITESDSATGQTTTITVDIGADTMRIVLTDSTGILADDTIAIPPGFAIPLPTNLSAQVTLSNFRTQPDGTILGDERFEANTYDVTPQSAPGTMVISGGFIFTPYNTEIAYSLNSGVSWVKFNPISRVTVPAGFFIEFRRPEACLAHGLGWTVIASRNGFSSNDMAMHWTNDVTLGSWPFNDSQGRVAGGDPVNAGVSFWSASDSSIGANHNRIKRWDIVQFANGLGPVMITNFHSDDTEAGNTYYHFFFPATGVFTHVPSFTFGSAVDKGPYLFWPEKNLLIARNRFSGGKDRVYKYDIVNNPAAPIINETLVHNLPGLGQIDPTMMFCTRDMFGIVYRTSTLDEWHLASTLDGTNWTDTVLGTFPKIGGDIVVNQNLPAAHPLAIYPGYLSDPMRDGRVMYHADSQGVYVSTDNAVTFNLINPVGFAAGDFDGSDWSIHNFVGDLSVNGLRHAVAMPFIWDGITLASFGPDNATGITFANSVHRMDDTFVTQTPKHGGPHNLNNPRQENITVGATLGTLGSVNGTPAANLRRYLGRSVVIPTGVANPPAPFNIRDTTKSAVYTSTRTKSYSFAGGTMRATITEGPGGLGSNAVTNIENGQYILIEIPPTSEAYAAAKKPIPIDMKWTPFPRGTFE